MKHIRHLLQLAAALLVAFGPGMPKAQAAETAGTAINPDAILIPDQAQPIMPLDQVRIGMKGYGLTVFHGTKIEPFAVEVLSITPSQSAGMGPKRGVIWILCTGPRLEKSGPLQGMSGSPIYLWDEGQAQEIGSGGRLIGAFAYGYLDPKECLAGVQPIEFMRNVASRIDTQENQGAKAGNTGGSRRGLEMLRQLTGQARSADISPIHRFRLEMLRRMFNFPEPNASPQMSPGPASDRQMRPILLPMSVPSPAVADAINPLLTPLGFAAVAAGGTGGSLIGKDPPPSIDAHQARLQPGSVLSIPLAFGDLDLAGVGTCTDVLPDGTVLGFGHSMYGEGKTAMPMATGYVHFFVSRSTESFKVSSSLQLAGSILQDENSAVTGNQSAKFISSPLQVSVQLPNQPKRTYQYQVVDHPGLTPVLAVICALESIAAVQNMPRENTMWLESTMHFTGGRQLQISSVLPASSAIGMAWELLPAIGAMMNNPYEQLKLEAMDVTINVQPRSEAASLLSAQIDQTRVEPGGKVNLTLKLQPYSQPVTTLRRQFAIPADTPEGDYQLMILDAWSYGSMMMAARPYLFHITNIDQFFETIKMMVTVRNDAMYAVMQLDGQNIALGRQPMEKLPSSRLALIATPNNSEVISYMQTIEQIIETDLVVSGQHNFSIEVRKPNSTFDN